MKRGVWGVAAFLLVAAVAAFFFWTYTKSNSPTHNLQTVKVAQVGEFFLYMPLYVAEGRGYFRDEGLDVQVINSGGDDKSVSALISGDVQFGIGDPTFAAIAGTKGQPIRVIGGLVNGVPFWGVAKNVSIKPITAPSQLKGLTVATFPSPSTAYTLQAQMFREGGLEPSIRQAQFGSLLALLDTGGADIALELEPNVSTAISQGAHVVYSLASKYGDFAVTGILTTDEMLTKKHDVVIKFVRAINRAEQFIHDRPSEAIAFAQSRFPQIRGDIVKAAMLRVIDANIIPKSVAISDTAWSKAVELRVKAGDLTSISESKPFLNTDIARAVGAR